MVQQVLVGLAGQEDLADQVAWVVPADRKDTAAPEDLEDPADLAEQEDQAALVDMAAAEAAEVAKSYIQVQQQAIHLDGIVAAAEAAAEVTEIQVDMVRQAEVELVDMVLLEVLDQLSFLVIQQLLADPAAPVL